jgi:hypothetical protein
MFYLNNFYVNLYIGSDQTCTVTVGKVLSEEYQLNTLQDVPKITKTIEITNNNLIVRIWMP